MVLTHGVPTAFRDNSNIYHQPPLGKLPSLSGHAIAYRWRSLLRVVRVTGCCLFRCPAPMDHFLCASHFQHPLQKWSIVDMCDRPTEFPAHKHLRCMKVGQNTSACCRREKSLLNTTQACSGRRSKSCGAHQPRRRGHLRTENDPLTRQQQINVSVQYKEGFSPILYC